METEDFASPASAPARQSSPNNNQPPIIIIEQAPLPPPIMVRQPMIIAERNPNRNSARGVAFCDIFLSVVGLIFATTLAILGIIKVTTETLNETEKNLYISGIVLSCFGIPGHLIELCVACSLLVATHPDTTHQESLRRARCWVYYNFFVIILVLVTGSVGSAYAHGANAFSGNFLMFFLRLCFICIVVNFIHELKINETGVDVVDYIAI